MRASCELLDFLVAWEGCRLKAYKPLPNDRWTIGVGTTFYEDGSPVKEGDVISLDRAKALLKSTLNKMAFVIAPKLNVTLKQNEFDAILSLAYNIGTGALLKSDTFKKLNVGINISDRFGLYTKSGGVVVDGLVKRREGERLIYDYGDYSSRP